MSLEQVFFIKFVFYLPEFAIGDNRLRSTLHLWHLIIAERRKYSHETLSELQLAIQVANFKSLEMLLGLSECSLFYCKIIYFLW